LASSTRVLGGAFLNWDVQLGAYGRRPLEQLDPGKNGDGIQLGYSIITSLFEHKLDSDSVSIAIQLW
jgi:hypothetical protein